MILVLEARAAEEIMYGAEAKGREIYKWLEKVQDREITLPRFQRGEVWDHNRICSLMNAIIKGLPLGVTLVLEVGDKPKFESRTLETAPVEGERITEQLLDGQQRLTAIWRVLCDNYEDASYFVEVKDFGSEEPHATAEVVRQSRWRGKNNKRYPLWCDKPKECLDRKLIPASLVCPTKNLNSRKSSEWVKKALGSAESYPSLADYHERWRLIESAVHKLCERIEHYNLPYLVLPSSTSEDVVLDVFVNMNTNGKPLSQYDIIAAQLESKLGMSLTEKIDKLKDEVPELRSYSNVSELLFNTESLVQGYPPNQAGAWKLDKDKFVDFWSDNVQAIRSMLRLLISEGITDERLLPSVSVMWVAAAIFRMMPKDVDQQGLLNSLLRQYLWRAFFTHRYEKSASTFAQQDYRGMKEYLELRFAGQKAELQAPVFDEKENPPFEIEELIQAGWPNRKSVVSRSVLALSGHEGAKDFATGNSLMLCPLGERHFHHIFPDDLLSKAGVENSYIALNCALIRDATNWNIGKKEPLKYLAERCKLATEDEVRGRLASHLIPIEEVQCGGYDGMEPAARKKAVAKDYDAFVRSRAQLVQAKALELGGFKDRGVSRNQQVSEPPTAAASTN